MWLKGELTKWGGYYVIEATAQVEMNRFVPVYKVCTDLRYRVLAPIAVIN